MTDNKLDTIYKLCLGGWITMLVLQVGILVVRYIIA